MVRFLRPDTIVNAFRIRKRVKQPRGRTLSGGDVLSRSNTLLLAGIWNRDCKKGENIRVMFMSET